MYKDGPRTERVKVFCRTKPKNGNIKQLTFQVSSHAVTAIPICIAVFTLAVSTLPDNGLTEIREKLQTILKSGSHNYMYETGRTEIIVVTTESTSPQLHSTGQQGPYSRTSYDIS